MGAPPSWITYIGTPNVDEAARLAASLGATIHKAPTDIPTIGRFAVVQDPQGASFALFTPNRPASEANPTVGDFSWHELATTDPKAAFAFYQRLFGWEETSSMDMGPEMGTYQMFGRAKAGPPLGGIFIKPKQMPGPSSWLPYIKVPDSKKTVEKITKSGGKVMNGPMEVPGGDWIAQGMDPQGAMFAVHSAKPAASAPAPAAPVKKAVKAKAAKKAAPKKKKAAPAKKSAAKRSAPKKRTAKKSPAKAKAPKKGKAEKSKKARKAKKR
jgi:predicted enzyme related to lactoylglutathione lyase